MEKILVLGGTGFYGYYPTEELLKKYMKEKSLSYH